MAGTAPSCNVFPIWDKDTGIVDFRAGEASALATPEIPHIRDGWTEIQRRLAGSQCLAEFNDQLNREWAIETGVVENLYDIDHEVTQNLIECGFKSELLGHGSTDKPREYVLRLLNDQKDSIGGIFDSVKDGRSLTTSYIKELHASLVQNQNTTEGLDSLGRHVNIPLIKGDWKTRDNHPVRNGVKYMYCPHEQVGSQMDRLVEIHSSHVQNGISSEAQAAWIHHRFTQIHPFQDGNGRVARALASLILVRGSLFPLLITRDDRRKYLEALEKADEGNLAPLTHMIVRAQQAQYARASRIDMCNRENQVNTGISQS